MPDWPSRLDSIARMRRAGRSWIDIAGFFEVSRNSITNMRRKYGAEIEERMIRQASIGKPVTHLPPAWAKGAASDNVSAKPKGKKGQGGE